MKFVTVGTLAAGLLAAAALGSGCSRDQTYATSQHRVSHIEPHTLRVVERGHRGAPARPAVVDRAGPLGMSLEGDIDHLYSYATYAPGFESYPFAYGLFVQRAGEVVRSRDDFAIVRKDEGEVVAQIDQDVTYDRNRPRYLSDPQEALYVKRIAALPGHRQVLKRHTVALQRFPEAGIWGEDLYAVDTETVNAYRDHLITRYAAKPGWRVVVRDGDVWAVPHDSRSHQQWGPGSVEVPAGALNGMAFAGGNIFAPTMADAVEYLVAFPGFRTRVRNGNILVENARDPLPEDYDQAYAYIGNGPLGMPIFAPRAEVAQAYLQAFAHPRRGAVWAWWSQTVAGPSPRRAVPGVEPKDPVERLPRLVSLRDLESTSKDQREEGEEDIEEGNEEVVDLPDDASPDEEAPEDLGEEESSEE